jgi:FAD/FMN-containing dehydrogenase
MRIADGLARIAKGEVLDDDWHKTVYSVDASHYQVKPEAIVYPVDGEDVRRVCQECAVSQTPIGPRGSGTGLLGQSLCDGVVLDFTKNMNRIMEIGEDYVETQPGVVKTVLDNELRKKDKWLPVDPASSNFCSIGGMISNNSSGIHCLGYGNTIDFLLGADLVYADGTWGYATESRYDEKCAALRALLEPNGSLVSNSFPKVNKNSCGYRIDAVIRDQKFSPHKVFAASEGTLGVITKARIRILDLPEHRCLLVFAFADLMEAIAAVATMLEFNPIALEMMDHTVVSRGSYGREAGCLVFAEFAGSRHSVESRSDSCRRNLEGRAMLLESASDSASLAKVWGARKGALNNIMKLTIGSRKPIGLIEDTVVPPPMLKGHCAGLLEEYKRHRLEYVMYGHVGDGNIHTRPLIDLESESQLRLMGEIADRIFARVVQSGGTITGEHGDGIGRLPYIPMVYGKPILDLFGKVKDTFDPNYLLNPGKKVPSRSAGTL